jgi:hypothetical protein
MATWTHYMGSCNQITARHIYNAIQMTTTTYTRRNWQSMEICPGTSGQGNHMTIMEPLCGKFLLHQEEGWEVTAHTGLSTSQQMDQEEPQCFTPHPVSD